MESKVINQSKLKKRFETPYLHRKNKSESNKGGVCDVDFQIAATHEHQNEHVKWNQVDDEDVTSPRGNLKNFVLHFEIVSKG